MSHHCHAPTLSVLSRASSCSFGTANGINRVRTYTPQPLLPNTSLCGSPPFSDEPEYSDIPMFKQITEGKYKFVGPVWPKVSDSGESGGEEEEEEEEEEQF